MEVAGNETHHPDCPEVMFVLPLVPQVGEISGGPDRLSASGASVTLPAASISQTRRHRQGRSRSGGTTLEGVVSSVEVQLTPVLISPKLLLSASDSTLSILRLAGTGP